LPRNASKFHLQPSRFEKFPPGENPGPLLTGAGREKERREGVKGFLPLKRGGRKGRDRGRGRGK